MTNRNLIVGLSLGAVVIVGFCGTVVYHTAHGAFKTMLSEAERMPSRMDTTHHVAPGSRVYLDSVPLASISRVVVIRADTAQASGGLVDSAVSAALRHRLVFFYTKGADSQAVATRLGGLHQWVGTVDGSYDSDRPVRITIRETAQVPRQLPDGYVEIVGSRLIPLF